MTGTTSETDEQTTAEPVVTATDIAKDFGNVSVLDGVDISVSRGEVACLLGPNGSGKTTLLRILAGLLDPDAGSVAWPEVDGRTVGYLPQTPSFRPAFTVTETVEFYGKLVDEDDVQSRLERVGLDPVADRRVDALSGGMVRLLGLAQATIGDPPILVLDEPASGLDPQMSRQVADTVDAIAETGRAVVLATHDLVSVDRIADTVELLDRGEIIARGSTAEIRSRTDTDSIEAAIDDLITRSDDVRVRAGGEQTDG